MEDNELVMSKIVNYNCDGMCIQKICSKKYTHKITREFLGLSVVLGFCKEHGEIVENEISGIKKTIILGHMFQKSKEFGDKNIPIILCEKRTDINFGMKFYCDFCKTNHLHGDGDGHRAAHCHNQNSPFDVTGYIITLNKNAIEKDFR